GRTKHPQRHWDHLAAAGRSHPDSCVLYWRAERGARRIGRDRSWIGQGSAAGTGTRVTPPELCFRKPGGPEAPWGNRNMIWSQPPVRATCRHKDSGSDLGSAGIENLKESPKMTNPRTSRGFIVSGCGGPQCLLL